MRAWTFAIHVLSQLAGRWCPTYEEELKKHGQVPRDTQDAPTHLDSLAANQWQVLLEPRLQWLQAHGADPKFAPFWRCWRKLPGGLDQWVRAINAELSCGKKAGTQVVVLGDWQYPTALAQLRDPPLALTTLGDLATLQRPCISIVGSRQATGRALVASFHAGRDLADAGYAIVSGGAFGCDTAAHRGVLASKTLPGSAVVVFAGGLRRLYPNHNQPIFDEILSRGGLWLSERLWGHVPRRWDFPTRNRIIAGLSSLTLVMMAHEHSGALLTARSALDEGRDVAVLEHPGPDIRATGGERLLQDGATPFGAEGPWPLPTL